ncbi:MAG: hypothetical protein ACLP9L_27850 [Thermoguttaceae bacterium]
MEAQLVEELISRWVSGDRLTPAEERSLLDWLETHPEARNKLLEDEALDSLLRSWPRLEDTAETFVQDCLHRAAGEGTDHRVLVSAVAAPPIIAPPVVLVRPSRIAGDTRPSRILFAGKTGRWVAAMVGCSAALLLGTIGLRWLTREPLAVETNQSAVPIAQDQGLRPETDRAFATLAQSTGAAWETPRSEGDRLAAGFLKLTAGTAELHFDKGSIARLTGPAVLELRNGDEVFLKLGSLTARVPPQAVGFLVATPLSQIVDLGTEFDVIVEDSGATQTLVRQGRVLLSPQRGQEDLGAPIELAAGALDRATISVPNIAASVLPVTTVARGSEGRFLGRLSADGKTAEFHSRTAFREFRALALKQLREAPSQFSQKWPALAAGAAESITAPAKSTVGHRSSPETDVAAGSHGNLTPGAVADGQTVDVQENGKAISITDSKESGITVTITESVDGKKKMTKVQAADLPELAKKNPEAHHLYGKYFRPRPKNGKPK